MRIDAAARRAGGRASERRERRRRRRASRCSRRCARATRFVLPRTSTPTATRSARWPAMQRVLAALGKDARRVHGRRRVPAALRVPLHRARRARHRAARRTSPSARSCSWTAATSTAPGRRRSSATARTSSTSTTTTTTRASGRSTTSCPSASCTAEIVWDLMQGARRRRSTQPIAEALYVGLVTDTGRFMYENTGPARARDGGRADRRRASTSHDDLPAPVRGHPAGQARAAGARAGQRRALRRRRC